MNPTLFEIGVAALMVAVSAVLIVWYLRFMAVASGRRMMHMLTRAGVDPEVAKQGDTEAIIDVFAGSRLRRSPPPTVMRRAKNSRLPASSPRLLRDYGQY